MDRQGFSSISFADAFALAQERYEETTDEVRYLRKQLRDRDVIIAGLQSKLGDQCALKLKNRQLTQELRTLKDGLTFLLQENPDLLERLTSMTTPMGKADVVNDAAAVGNGMQRCPVDAIQALALKGKNFIARLPFEMRADIFMYLDRFSLDRAGFSCPQFSAVVGCLAGGSLRVLTSVRLNVTMSSWAVWDTPQVRRENRPAEGEDAPPEKLARLSSDSQEVVAVPSVQEEGYDFGMSVDYSSDPMALMCGSEDGRVTRQWSFSDTAMATSHFIGLLRHASVSQLSMSGPLPLHLLEALSSTDMDVVVEGLKATDLTVSSGHLALARSALTSFNYLQELTLGDAVPLHFVTDDFLDALKNMGVISFEFRSKHFAVQSRGGWANQTGRRVVTVDYNGAYSSLDAGLTAFLFDDDLDDQQLVALRLPAARVPKDICKRLLKTAIANRSRNPLMLSFVAVIDDLTVELEGFEEFVQDADDDILLYELPPSPASDVLLELKITTLEDAPNDWKLVEFRRYKKPPPSTAGGGDGWGGGGGGGWGGYGGGGGGWGGYGGGGGGWGGPGRGSANGGFGGGAQWGGGAAGYYGGNNGDE